LTKSISTVVSIHDLGWLVFWLLLFFSIKLVELVPLTQLWTHSLFFTFTKLKVFTFNNVNTLRGSTNFFSLKTQFLQFVWICSNKIHSKINISSTPYSSENSEINYIKSDSSRAFQQCQERPKFQYNFQF
jgi:hypothetical protein